MINCLSLLLCSINKFSSFKSWYSILYQTVCSPWRFFFLSYSCLFRSFQQDLLCMQALAVRAVLAALVFPAVLALEAVSEFLVSKNVSVRYHYDINSQFFTSSVNGIDYNKRQCYSVSFVSTDGLKLVLWNNQSWPISAFGSVMDQAVFHLWCIGLEPVLIPVRTCFQCYRFWITKNVYPI